MNEKSETKSHDLLCLTPHFHFAPLAVACLANVERHANVSRVLLFELPVLLFSVVK